MIQPYLNDAFMAQFDIRQTFRYTHIENNFSICFVLVQGVSQFFYSLIDWNDLNLSKLHIWNPYQFCESPFLLSFFFQSFAVSCLSTDGKRLGLGFFLNMVTLYNAKMTPKC